MDQPHILVTGFVPFLKHGVNSSQAVVERLARQRLPGVDTLVLPVEFGRGFEKLLEYLQGARPRAIVLLGMAAGARNVRLERLAVNLADCESFGVKGRRTVRRPDNGGAEPLDQPIVPGGPLALPARADVKALGRALKGRGLPVELSLSAGSYVCNDIYYRTLDHLERTGDPAACLFVHLPELARPRAKLLGVPLPFQRRGGRTLGTLARTIAALVEELAR